MKIGQDEFDYRIYGLEEGLRTPEELDEYVNNLTFPYPDEPKPTDPLPF